MRWLNDLIGRALGAAGLDLTKRWTGSLQFFIYDVIKITILLCTLIFVISYIQSFFPPERSKKILGRFRGIGANIVAALLGTVTPFCSCSSIPLFIGFTSAGLPVGVTFFLPDFVADGRPWLACAAHEHIRRKGRNYLCALRDWSLRCSVAR